MITKSVSFPDEILRIYKKYSNDRFIGVYGFGGTPFVLIKDPDLIKTICIKDADSFQNHKVHVPDDIDPILGRALFFMVDQKWRDMRSILSPLFNGRKMRNMIRLIDDVAIDFSDTLRPDVIAKREFDIFDLVTTMTCDLILSCAFGIKMNSLKDRNNEFYKAGIGMAYSLQNLNIFIVTQLPTKFSIKNMRVSFVKWSQRM